MECTENTGSYANSYFTAARDEVASAGRVLSQFFPDGPVHALCGTRLKGRAAESFMRGERSYCRSCGCKFTPTAGTILQDSRLSFWQYELLLVLTDLGIEPRRISGIIEVHADTVRNWQQRLQVLQGVR